MGDFLEGFIAEFAHGGLAKQTYMLDFDRNGALVSSQQVLTESNLSTIAPGMPEAGYIPIPKKLGRLGVKDMVRMSDARMSGTAFGTIVLHIAPEAAARGPFAAVRNGDMISLDVPARTLTLEISDEEMVSRLAAWTPPRTLAEMPSHGYRKLYQTTVTQADIGCDFDFMLPAMTMTAPVFVDGRRDT